MTKISIIGAGGHAKVAIDVAVAANGSDAIEGVYDEDAKMCGRTFCGHVVQPARGIPPNALAFAAVGDNGARKGVVDRRPHLVWATLAHPSAVVAKSAQIGPGALICAGCVVQPGAVVAAHCVLNTKSSLDHDSTLADFVHLGPGCTVCGHVKVGEGAFVGAGSVVKDRVHVEAWCVVGCGAAVVEDVGAGSVVAGVPARLLRPRV